MSGTIEQIHNISDDCYSEAERKMIRSIKAVHKKEPLVLALIEGHRRDQWLKKMRGKYIWFWSNQQHS